MFFQRVSLADIVQKFVKTHPGPPMKNPWKIEKRKKWKKSFFFLSPRVRKHAIIFRVILAHDDLRFKSYELKTFKFQLLVRRNFWNFRTFGGPEKIREVVFEKRKNVETRSLTRTSQITCFSPSRTMFWSRSIMGTSDKTGFVQAGDLQQHRDQAPIRAQRWWWRWRGGWRTRRW